jgi:hypothetical protein
MGHSPEGEGGELARPQHDSAAATLSQHRSLCPPHTPTHTAPLPLSSPRTSAVLLVVLPLPLVDVAGKLAAGPLEDACPSAAARLDLLSLLLITVCSFSQFPPPRFLSAVGIDASMPSYRHTSRMHARM